MIDRDRVCIYNFAFYATKELLYRFDNPRGAMDALRTLSPACGPRPVSTPAGCLSGLARGRLARGAPWSGLVSCGGTILCWWWELVVVF